MPQLSELGIIIALEAWARGNDLRYSQGMFGDEDDLHVRVPSDNPTFGWRYWQLIMSY